MLTFRQFIIEEKDAYRIKSDRAHEASKHAYKATKRAAESNSKSDHHDAMAAHEFAMKLHHIAGHVAPSPLRKSHHLEHAKKHQNFADEHYDEIEHLP